jgi:hypothetical protein
MRAHSSTLLKALARRSETHRNGIKTGLAMLTSLPGVLPGIFPDLPGLRVFVKGGFSLPVSLPGNFPDLPGLRLFWKERHLNGFLFPFLFPETSRIFPDCGLLIFYRKRLKNDSVSGVE